MEIPDRAIISGLRRAARKVSGNLSEGTYDRLASKDPSLPTLVVILSRFEWNEAKRLAGLPTIERTGGQRGIPAERMISDLLRVRHALEDFPSLREYEAYRREHNPTLTSSETIRRHAWPEGKGWVNALRQARKKLDS